MALFILLGIFTQTIPTSTAVAQTTPGSNQPNSIPYVWIIIRATGIISYILLTLLAGSGMLLTTGVLFRIISPATAWSVHRAMASTMTVSIILHVGMLLFDQYIGMNIIHLLVPFVSPYQTVLVALGIIGMYLLVLLLATSLYTFVSHPRFWRAVHYLAFPAFVLLFIHGMLIGTDSQQPWMTVIYWDSILFISLCLVYRITWKFTNPNKTGDLAEKFPAQWRKQKTGVDLLNPNKTA